MHAFAVTYTLVHENEQTTEEQIVEAAYYQAEGEFVTFKDAEHKQIASFHARNVISVTRSERKTAIGTVVVNVAPQLDSAAMDALVEQLEERARRGAGPFIARP